MRSGARGERRRETLAALRDPERRPPTRQVPLPPDFRSSHPRDPLALNSQRFLRNVRSGRRGAAAGPSGCTAERLRVLAGQRRCAGRRAGRRALREDGGLAEAGRRGAGTCHERRVPPAGGRTLAQQYAGAFQAACAPFQYALRTRAGAESLARAVRAATELDARTTVLSMDGVGAYDHISRASMLSGLQHTPSLTALLPFVAQFYAEPSAYVFYDAEGAAHEIAQGEGGEQGDPLMPALYALGQHPALLQAQAALTPGEDLYAYLDDIYVTCQPKRAGPAFTALGTALGERANIRVHLDKTRAWNAAGEEPSALLDALPAAARADAWAGSWARPPAQQGITVLGTHAAGACRVHRGSAATCQREARRTPGSHFPRCHTCRAPGSSCSSARSLGAITCSAYCRPLTRESSPSPTTAIARCLGRLLSGTDEPFELSQLQARRAQLPLRYGGLGLRSAAASRAAAYWASWADAMPVIGERHPRVLARMLMGLADPRSASAAPSTRAAAQAEAALRLAGFHAPPWTALADGLATGEASHFGDAARGWQQAACASLDQRALETLLSDLDGASRALLLSQAGPGGSLALTALPTREEFTLQDDTFRCVLLRRLRLPLPLEARACRCGGALDELGDHRAACPTAGVLVRRACPLERAAARICREAGARVATNVFLRDLNLGLPLTDGRRLEVVEETEAFLHRIAQGRALASPAAQRTAVAAAYRRRRGQMLAVAAQGAFAASLCQLPTDVGDAYASAPLEGDVLSDARWAPGA